MNLDKIIAVRTAKTVYRDGDRTVKVFNENYSAADVLSEALNLARVYETGLKAPKLIEVTKVGGKWAIVTEYIEGRTLSQLMEEHPELYDEYMDRFVDIQIGMLSHTAPALTKLTDKMHRKICESGLDATARYDLHTRLDSLPKQKKLCHGDYNPSNIIINESGDAYIIDWSHATQGSAGADAARTYLLFWLSGDIKGAELYMKLFCKKTDTARQYVEKWIAIVFASQLGKGRPQEREFLLHWANVVDYQ